MIKIQVVDKIHKKIEAFQRSEWIPADIAHFGHKIAWDKIIKVFTATEDDRLVGVLELNIQVGVMHVEALIVDHNNYGQGIGKKLIQKAEEIARENHLHKIYLETGKKWEAARFYETLGYAITGTLPNHFEHQDFVEYTKFLS